MPTNENPQHFGPCSAKTGGALQLAMQDLWLTGTVLPTGARLVVRHVFQSREPHPLEVIYAFALPRDAAMRRFRIVGEGFETHSELRPVEEAERLYESGIESGHLSALARAYGDGLVNLSVGNVRPGETVSVFLEIAAGVELHDDGYRFRFPFTLAPGYHPRATAIISDSGEGEMALPEDEFGDLILPPWRHDATKLHRVGFDLALDVPSAALAVASPSHPISVRQNDTDGPRVQLAVAADVPNRDLVLDVQYREKRPIVLAGIDATGKGRFAAVVPSTCFGDIVAGPRRTVFLIDRSGSMGGEPIHQALRATEACLGALTEQDLFGIVAYDNQTESLAGALLPATQENRRTAEQFVRQIDARGGTELAGGVDAAARVLGPAGGDVILLTDGQVFGGEAILARVGRTGVRLHCLGIGSASQDRFLALMARETGGTSRFVTPRERVDMALLQVFAAIGAPVATGLNCQAPQDMPVSIAPEIPRAVYGGSPLVILGSFEGATGGTLQLAWDGGAALGLEMTVKTGPLGEALKIIQGARLITDAESHMASNGESSAGVTSGDITAGALLAALSTEYELASRAMALVTVVQRQGDVAGQLPATQVVPVGLPQDVQMDSYMLASAPSKFSMSRLSAMSSPLFASSKEVCIISRETCDRNTPSILRRRSRRPERTSASPINTVEDLLVTLASIIQPDGGAPGRDAGQRIAASLLLLLLFQESVHSAGRGAFSAHIRRLKRFLEQVDRSGLDENQTTLSTRALKLLDESKSLTGPWEQLARQYNRKGDRWRADVFWKAVADVLSNNS